MSSSLYRFPWMDRALELAKKAESLGEVPVGAVIVHRGQLIAEGWNRTEMDHDPTAHAEMIAIREACKQLQTPRLQDCELFVTLEPCPMCAQAISNARIQRLYFGAPDPKGGGVLHGVQLFHSNNALHRPEIYPDIQSDASAALLQAFFQKRRG